MRLPSITPQTDDQARLRANAARAVKDLVRKEFGLDADASVFVAEIACGEADCPDVETVIAIFQEGRRRELRFAKPVQELTGRDISLAATAGS